MAYDPSLAPAIRRVAGNLGINPSDLGTAISYETGGTMDPNQRGGAGNRYLGLIQFGPEEQSKYGIKPGMSVDDHMGAVENYLRDRGVKPGMGMLDIYSTINAGSPGRYNASDANNGGAPGTVADKVATQMVGHRARAEALLGNDPYNLGNTRPSPQSAAAAPDGSDPYNVANPGAQAQPTAPAGQAAGGIDSDKLIAALGGIQKQMQPQQDDTPPPQINIAQPAGLPVAQRLSAIMQSMGRPS